MHREVRLPFNVLVRPLVAGPKLFYFRNETLNRERPQAFLYTNMAAPLTLDWDDLLTTIPWNDTIREELIGVSQDTNDMELSPEAVVPVKINSEAENLLCLMSMRKVASNGNLELECNQHALHSCMKRLRDIAKLFVRKSKRRQIRSLFNSFILFPNRFVFPRL